MLATLLRERCKALSIKLPADLATPMSLLMEIIAQQLMPAPLLVSILAEFCHLPIIDLEQINDEQIELNLLSEKFMRFNQVLIFRNAQQHLCVSCANPAMPDFALLNFWLKEPVYWTLTAYDKLSQRIAHILHHQAQQQLTTEDSITRYVEKLFADALHKRASDIHIETIATQVRIRLRIDGLLYEQAYLAGDWSARLLTHLKVLAQLDITERRLPQDGRLQILLPPRAPVDCRFSTCPTVDAGEKAVLRLLNRQTVPLAIEQLGFHPTQQVLFSKAIEQPQGMILVTGPTGSGKTVTLYSALQQLNKSHVNIASIEDPVEIILTGINQVPVNPKIDLTFAKVLRALLRQDPDIIMLGEMRDAETANMALQAAQTGHLVLSTLHTNSAVETLTRLLQMNIATYQLAASVSLIIAQRLLRLLCSDCKIVDQQHSQNTVNLVYQAVGCKKCQQGYRGRTAIYECLPITPTFKQAILQQATINDLTLLATQAGMLSLEKHGWQKIQAGITTPAELARVIQTVH